MEKEIIILLIAGATGALIKEILVDNALNLPKIKDGQLILGFLGSLILGAFVGYVVDGGFLTAALAGYTGFSAIEAIIQKKQQTPVSNTNSIAKIIFFIAKEEGVDPNLALAVAKCESGLDPKARNINTNGSIDRGLYQINNKYHPTVSDIEADDPIFATKFFCKAFKNGHLSWWKATQTCWEK